MEGQERRSADAERFDIGTDFMLESMSLWKQERTRSYTMNPLPNLRQVGTKERKML